MKKRIIGFVIIAGLLAPRAIQSQGVIYLSNLTEPSIGTSAVASNSVNGLNFITGANAGGYLLDSVQLSMANATGNPGGFSVMLNVLVNPLNGYETNVGALIGSRDPSSAGVYAYAPDSGLLLSANTYYTIILTAETTATDGAYEWNLTSTRLGSTGNGWAGPGFGNFSIATEFPQYAITATPMPEPGVLSLFALGGLGFLWQRRKAKAF